VSRRISALVREEQLSMPHALRRSETADGAESGLVRHARFQVEYVFPQEGGIQFFETSPNN
jgi:hypothetical protein